MNKRKVMLSHIVAGIFVSQFSLLAEVGGNATKLDEVLVTSAAGYEQKLIDAPASISVITAEDLQKKSFTNLLDAVEDTEGVDFGVSRDKTGQGGISIRGLGTDYTLVLIDGKKQNDHGDIFPNSFGGSQYAFIPPISMIERIEIIRGPMSTLYGSEAIGGVINIITKKISNEWIGSFTQSQTFQTDTIFGNDKTSDFALQGPIIKDLLGLSIRGSYYDKEASTPRPDSIFSGANSLDNQNWSAGAGLTLTPNENHTIKANFDISKQRYDHPVLIDDPDDRRGGSGTISSPTSIWNNSKTGYSEVLRNEREQWSLDWEAIWGFGKSTIGIHDIRTANLGRTLPFNATERRLIQTNKLPGGSWDTLEKALADSAFLELADRPTRTLESRATTYSAKYEMPFDKHHVVIGAEYIDGELEDSTFGMTGNSATALGVVQDYKQFAFYAEDSWSITDNFTLTAGARYDDNEDFGGHVSPRAYGVYTVDNNWTVKGGISTGYKTPKTTDLFDGIYGFGGQGTSPFLGNPDLEPETSVSTELALYYTHDDGHNFNITVFRNDFKDYIRSVRNAGTLPPEWAAVRGLTVSQDQNVGQATMQGIELAGKYQILDHLAVRGNYTYVDSEVEDTGNPLGEVAEHLFNTTIDYDVNDKFSTFLKVSGEFNRWRDNDDLLENYKNYTVADLGGSYRLADNITVHARINNLFDDDFTSQTNYINGEGDLATDDDYVLIQKRREFWISMQVTF